MNHPLPQSNARPSMAYEFVKAITEASAAATQPPESHPEAAHLHTQDDVAALQFPVQATEEAAPMANTSAPIVEETNDAYEAYRRRILAYHAEQEVVSRRAYAGPQPAARALSHEDIDQLRRREYYYDPAQYYARAIEQKPAQHAAPEHEAFFRNGFLNRGLAIAAAATVVAGCTLGIAITKQDEIRDTATRTLAYVGAILPADRPAHTIAPSNQTSTILVKKPIATASLDVADVTGTPNSTIPLTLRADPALEGKDISIRISGLPENAILTAGHKQDERTWVLADEDLANVGLVVPDASVAKFDLSVAAIETKTGELASPVREMTVALTAAAPANQTETLAIAVKQVMPVTPAATPAQTEASQVTIAPANAAPELQGSAAAVPQAQPIPAPVAAAPAISPEAQGLLQKGDVLLKNGDLVMARQFYMRAVDLGAPQGALGVAKTYDPAVFKELNVQGIVPDAAQAEHWYRKASAAGVVDATNALARFDTTAALPQQ